MQVFDAIYEDGVLKPASQLGIAPGTRVRVTIEAKPEWVQGSAAQELDELCEQFPVNASHKLTRDQLHERR